MKRGLSDSDSDDMEYESDRLTAGSPSQSCQITDRKRRRGVIEKRRRDRINGSLSELRRLIPQAFEKQGSAKLEKAEILQMAVDHLKTLHSKGINGYNFPDANAIATDYRSVGFRECASEVARYLVTVEGLDVQDPLRLRMTSHLQCSAAQRDAAAKASSLQSSSWNSLPPHVAISSQYNSSSMCVMSQPTDQLSATSHPSALSAMPAISCRDSSRIGQNGDSSHIYTSGAVRFPTTGSVAPHMPTVTSSSVQVSPPVMGGLSQVHTPFLGANSMPMSSTAGTHNYNSHTSLNQTLSAVKPYRPWGAELAY